MKIIIYRASNKKWYARIVGRNGEKIFGSGDGYERKAGAMKAANLIRKFGPSMPIQVKK